MISDTAWVAIIAFTIAGILYALFSGSEPRFHEKLERLGEVCGLPRQQIEQVLGKPNSISAIGDGGFQLQWLVDGAHLSLLFDSEGICLGVSHYFRGTH